MFNENFKGTMAVLVVGLLLYSGEAFTQTSKTKATNSISRLELHLNQISTDARKKRHIGGATAMGTGALLIAGSAALADSASRSAESSGAVVAGSFGAGLVIGGIVVLANQTEFETLPLDYTMMPEKTVKQRAEKNLKGEIYLSRLSNKGHKQRLIGAATQVISGAITMGLFSSSNDEFLDQLMFYEGALFIGLGLIDFIKKSESETEYENYVNWKRSFKSASNIKVGVVPSKKGAMLAATLQF